MAVVTDTIRVIAKPNPFSSETYECHHPAGASLSDIIGGVYADVYAQIDDVPVHADDWPMTIPPAGSTVLFLRAPQGPLKVIAIIIAQVAAQIAAAAAYAVGFAAGFVGGSIGSLMGAAAGALGITTGQLAMGLISIIGSAVTSLVKPQAPTMPSGALSANRYASLTGGRNSAQRFSVLPMLYGKYRISPPLAANYYTETVGNDQYMHMLICLSYGRLSIDGHLVGGASDSVLTKATTLSVDTIRIGTTDIARYKGVQYEIGRPDQITLYPQSILEQVLSITLNNNGDNAIRTTATATERISIDIQFAALQTVEDDGSQIPNGINFKVEYRAVGATPWINQGTWTITGNTTDGLRRNRTWTVTAGQYEVRVTRIDRIPTTGHAQKFMDQCSWVALRSIRQNAQPWTKSGMTLMALRIKASGQLNGSVDDLNILCQRVLRVWTGSAWVEQATSNPAWAYADALQGPQLNNPIADNKIDLTALKAWADWCDNPHNETPAPDADHRIEYNWYHTDSETLVERIRSIASCGRASWSLLDTKFSVVRDLAMTPMQLISPRNAKDFKLDKSYVDYPHALRVRYINQDNWQQDERIVYDDGYSADGAGGTTVATRYELLETQGVITPEQAFREGRYYLATLRLRPETYEVTMDFENLACTRGDTVKLAYDVMLVGLSFGRIKSVTVNGSSQVTAITTDEICTMVTGKTYAIRVRTVTGTHQLKTVATVAGDQTTLTLTSPITSGTQPATGDLFAFGESGLESIDAKVSHIQYRADLSAIVKLVPAAAEILNADAGTIPAWNPSITYPPEMAQPPAPTMLALTPQPERASVRTDGGRNIPLLATWVPPSGIYQIDRFEVRWADASTDMIDTTIRQVNADTNSYLLVDLAEGVPVSVDVRARSVYGVWSVWSDPLTATPALVTIDPPTAPSAAVDAFLAPDGTVDMGIWVAWTLSAYPNLAGYELQWKADDESDWKSRNVGPGATVYRITQARVGRIYTVQIRAVTVTNQFSAWAAPAPLTITAYAGAPAAPTAFTATGDRRSILLKWTNPSSLDFAGVEIYENTTNSSGSATLIATVAANAYTRTGLGSNVTRYYWLKSVNRSGNKSAFSAASSAATLDETVTTLAALVGSINETYLTSSLGTRLNGIEASANAIYWIQHEIGGTTATTYDLQYQVNNLVSVASSKNSVFRQSGTPAALANGDIWIDTGNGNAIKVWNGSSWVLSDNTAIAANTAAISSESATRASADTAIAGTVTSLTATVATKVSTFYAGSAPTATATGDLWVDTANGNSIKRWNGSAWVAVDNTAIAAATANITSLQGAQATETSARAWSDYWVTSEAGLNTATVQVHQESINGLSAQYTVKIDNNGYVSGFGLASDATNGTPVSTFMVRADRMAFTNGTNSRNSISAGALTRSGSTATLSYTGIGSTLAAGDWLELRGYAVPAGDATANPPAGWNDLWQVATSVANAVTFTVPSGLTATPTFTGSADWTKVYTPMVIQSADDPITGTKAGVYIDEALIRHAAIDTLMLAGNVVSTPYIGMGSVSLTTTSLVEVVDIGIVAPSAGRLTAAKVQVSSLTKSGTTATLITSSPHGISVNDMFGIIGVTDTGTDAEVGGWNKCWLAATVPNSTTLTFVISSTEATKLSSPATVTNGRAAKLTSNPVALSGKGIIDSSGTTSGHSLILRYYMVYPPYLIAISNAAGTFYCPPNAAGGGVACGLDDLFYPPLDQNVIVALCAELTSSAAGGIQLSASVIATDWYR